MYHPKMMELLGKKLFEPVEDDYNEDDVLSRSHLIVTGKDEIMLINSSQANLPPPNNHGGLVDVDIIVGTQANLSQNICDKVEVDVDSTNTVNILSPVNDDIVEDDTNAVSVVPPNHSQMITEEETIMSQDRKQKLEKRIESE